MKVLTLMALLGYIRAETDWGNEGQFCLSNEECDAATGLRCGFYKDYKDTGRHVMA